MDMQKLWPKVRRLEDQMEKQPGDYTRSVVLTQKGAVHMPFSDLIGLKVVDFRPNRRRLCTPSALPGFSDNRLVWSGGNYDSEYQGLTVSVSNLNILSKRVIVIAAPKMHLCCPMFGADYPGKNAIIYCFEPTSDTMGLGLTLPQGWYAVNNETFSYAPFDLEKHPVEIVDRPDVDSTFSWAFDEGVTSETGDYAYWLFPQTERTSYIVAGHNIAQFEGAMIVSQADLANFDKADPISEQYYAYWQSSFGWNPLTNEVGVSGTGDSRTGISTTVTGIVTQKLDPKFLPNVDSVTLNAPGGKQFKLTVDDSGAIKATEVT